MHEAKRWEIWCAAAPVGLASALLVGCIDTDTAVFVDATIDSPGVEVGDEALGVTLSGEFQLTLHLGARASGPSEVSYASFSLKTASGTVVVESLPVSPSLPSPADVEPGGTDTVVTFTIDTGTDLLPAELKEQLCAEQVVIAGIIEDSLATTGTPVESEPFDVNGC